MKEYLNEAARYGVEVLPPSINASGFSFQLQNENKFVLVSAVSKESDAT